MTDRSQTCVTGAAFAPAERHAAGIWARPAASVTTKPRTYMDISNSRRPEEASP